MLRPQDIIRHKRDGAELTDAEIRFFVEGVGSGAVADYQATALLMAIFLRGMSERERLTLTSAMLKSGAALDFSDIPRPKVDKHSTGGVGDKTSLIIAPLAAACGLCVPMISGRGLGHTGGTLDKLEAIPGYRVHLGQDEFREILGRVGFAMTGQTGEIAPVDRKFYALRDVTATIEAVPLISASIMSKKLAEGLDGLVLDVKCGAGAFMKTDAQARELAEALVGIGRGYGVRTIALITDMNQPLGRAIGNRLEVIESIETLKGRGAEDLTALSIELTVQMLVAGGVCENVDAGSKRVRRALADGSGLRCFRESIVAQGGDVGVVDNYAIMPEAVHREAFKTARSGYVARLDAEAVGIASMMLGAGRVQTKDEIDPAVGILLNKKIGDLIADGELLAEIHYNGDGGLSAARRLLAEAFEITDAPPAPLPLVKAVV